MSRELGVCDSQPSVLLLQQEKVFTERRRVEKSMFGAGSDHSDVPLAIARVQTREDRVQTREDVYYIGHLSRRHDSAHLRWYIEAKVMEFVHGASDLYSRPVCL